MKIIPLKTSDATSNRKKPRSGQSIARIRETKRYPPNINVLMRVKKKGSQEKKLEAEVVVGKIKISSSNLFNSMVGQIVSN